MDNKLCVCKFGHNECQEILDIRINEGKISKYGGGVIVCLIIHNYYKYKGKPRSVIYLGKQRRGKYKKKYNLCMGKKKSTDSYCYKQTAIRELREEFKISLYNGRFKNFFMKNDGTFRYMMYGGFPSIYRRCSQFRKYSPLYEHKLSE